MDATHTYIHTHTHTVITFITPHQNEENLKQHILIKFLACQQKAYVVNNNYTYIIALSCVLCLHILL